MRRLIRPAATVVLFAVAFAAGHAGAQSKRLIAEMIQSDLLASPGMNETRPLLDPERFADRPPVVAAAYRAAREIPQVLDKLFCYCYCETNPKCRHKSLLTCYTDEHAAGCGVCIQEALAARGRTAEGKTPRQIAREFADRYLTGQQ